jgi:uncharacterized protein (TIGR00369 family)
MEFAQNRLSRNLSKVNRLPGPIADVARTAVMGRIVKFVGTAGLHIEELTEARCVVALANKTKVQNHIGGIHAAAMALLAETATGFVVGMNVPDDRVPVIKTMRVDYIKRAKGDLRAVATLSDEERARMRSDEKGEVTVAVIVTDGANVEPIRCEMVWAWTGKRRNP